MSYEFVGLFLLTIIMWALNLRQWYLYQKVKRLRILTFVPKGVKGGPISVLKRVRRKPVVHSDEDLAIIEKRAQESAAEIKMH